MKNTRKRIYCLILALALLAAVLPQNRICAEAEVNCKTLCGAALKAAGGGSRLKYTSTSAIDFGGLPASVRSRVKSIQYICDAKEVYSLCVAEAADHAGAKEILKALKKYKKNNCSSDYLSDYSKAEKKVFKNAVCGRKGKVVWYVALSPKKAKNKKGQAAIKKGI